jgi:hypothetical protein
MNEEELLKLFEKLYNDIHSKREDLEEIVMYINNTEIEIANAIDLLLKSKGKNGNEEEVKMLHIGDRVRIEIEPHMNQFPEKYKYLEFTLDGLRYNYDNENLEIEMKDIFLAIDIQEKK